MNYKINDIDDLQKIGIYKITCNQSAYVYIGSASCTSKNTSPSKRGFLGRWNDHFNKLRLYKHRNKHLQNAFNKYGEDSFEFSIIEICEKESCLLREQYWIDYYINTHQVLFNISKTAGIPNYERTDEHKKSMSKLFRGKTRDYKIHQSMRKPVLQYTPDGQLVEEYDGISIASRKTGIQRVDIGAVCNNKHGHKSAGGYIWKFKNNKLTY